MKHLFVKTIPSISISIVLSLLIFTTFSCASTKDFSVVLIDMASKKPMQSARIILAPKTKGKYECTIDTSLTGVSNERGEVLIPNVAPGEYVLFYNLSGSLKPELKGKVVDYERAGNDDYVKIIIKTLGPLALQAGGQLGIVDGLISVNNGHMYAANYDLAMIASEGKLLKVTIPIAESTPLKIEIHNDIAK